MAEKIIKPITKSFEAIVGHVVKFVPGKKRKPRKKEKTESKPK